MEERKILERIIDEQGSCDWALKFNSADKHYICSRCPMSRLAKNKDGEYLSCFEALGCQDAPPHIEYTDLYVNERYIKKAKELLSDILMEDIIKDD